ncbi:unnamed protein product [Phaedon cochleariae]|uniref:WH1 domain-containing protein n=1 Tax=Phaedon cochleariae TaxID=80249 RepID=A0A9N9SD71_PHACE|nr:unnamed protein product [Phaedon cochleariae]
MSRDDSSGGWVPLGGGGLSNVSVRKRPRPPQPPPGQGGQPPPPCPAAAPDKPKHDYLIYGKRISDNSVVLSCTIKKDFEYNKVMPTFHHWKTGDKKFGLTFQAAADARAFDKGVRTAVEDLLDGFVDTSPLSLLPNCTKDVGDDDVFMTLDLPQDPKDSRSSSDSSTKGTEHLHRITYIGGGRDKPIENRQPTYDPNKGAKDPAVGPAGGETYPYVQLTAVHEYVYPSEERGRQRPRAEQPPALARRDSAGSIKKGGVGMEMAVVQQQPPLPLKGKKGKVQIRCRHCQELYTEEHNPRGACEYAPDGARACINRVTCFGCAQCVDYHCASDQEGDTAQHPCDCAGAGDENCARRWCCLALLSLFVPCLWLYPPLKMCHWCGIKCGLCGGRHAM